MNDWDYEQSWVAPHIKKYIATHMIHTARIQTCEKCDCMNKLKICTECGCFLPAKTLLKSEQCPLGKWGPEE